MRTNRKKLINGLLVLLCILSAQMVGPRLLLAADSMTLTAAPTSVKADGVTASVITATVFNGLTPQSGVTLKFTATGGEGLPSGDVTSDSAGKAIVTLTSTSAGTVIVTCKAPTDSTTTPIDIVSNVSVTFTAVPIPTPIPDPPFLASFVLSVVNPTVTVGDLANIPTITAQMYDQYGKTFKSPGVSVVFTTDFGNFANNLKSITVSTTEQGNAAAFLYSEVVGTATVNAKINLFTTNPVFVNFIGAGSPAFISLSASPYRIPADGSFSAITAVISDKDMQRVAAGTAVTFSTTLGVFENGKTTITVATQTDDPNANPPTVGGTVTVYLRATSINATGFAVITCTAGSATQSLTVQFVHMEYETEPNNSMVSADGICFDYVYYSQLFSPYDEDWYTFTITTPSRIGINFITTATPADAGCFGTTTIGTWKVDIRDLDNNVLMSRHNIDCIFDNGIWETGVIPPGTYYVVVYCPRLGDPAPDGDPFLSDFYYLSVFNNFYFPCGDRDKLANSASLTQESSDYQLRIPIVDTTPYLSVDFQYDPRGMFKLTDSGVLTNVDRYRSCNLSNLSLVGGNYVLHVPVVIFDGVSYRVDMIYVPTTDGLIWFMPSGVWLNK